MVYVWIRFLFDWLKRNMHAIPNVIDLCIMVFFLGKRLAGFG